jgi:hypothetical protein
MVKSWIKEAATEAAKSTETQLERAFSAGHSGGSCAVLAEDGGDGCESGSVVTLCWIYPDLPSGKLT